MSLTRTCTRYNLLFNDLLLMSLGPENMLAQLLLHTQIWMRYTYYAPLLVPLFLPSRDTSLSILRIP